MSDALTCKCLSVVESLSRGLHEEPVEPCEMHGTFGNQPDQGQPAEPMALNSPALEASLLGALNQPQAFNL